MEMEVGATELCDMDGDCFKHSVLGETGVGLLDSAA